MGRYRRTVSFQNPNPIPKPNPNPNPDLNISKHVRSVSLPCGGTNPLIPHLHHHLTELRSWAGASGSGSTRVVDGLTRLNSMLNTYDDVLQLPQTQDDVVESVERLLEHFLQFVDVYERFRSTMLGFKQDLSSAQVAVRRMDRDDLSHYVTVHKKAAVEINKLISTIGSMSTVSGDLHDEIAYVIKSVTGSILGSIGLGRTRGRNWAGFGFGIRKDGHEDDEGEFVKVLEGIERLMELSKKRKRNNNEKEEMKKEVMKKMEEMEKCVAEMEIQGEKVFRSLIITRVSLLNILTHA